MRVRALAAALLCLGLAGSAPAVELEVMALSGQRVGGKALRSIEAPYVGPDGAAAFIGWLGNGRALFHWDTGELRVVARDGHPAAGLASGHYNGIVFLGFDDAGRVYFSSNVFTSAQKLFDGVWSWNPATKKCKLRVLAPRTYPVVGRIELLGSPSIGSAGHVAFTDQLDRLLLLAPEGTLSVVATPGDAAPGAPGFAYLEFDAPFRVGAGGEVGFNAVVDDGGPNLSTGVWKRPLAGPIALVGMEGGQVPGAAPGSAFSSVAAQDGNAMGALSLDAALEPGTGDVNAANARCVLGPNGGSGETILARSNEPAPGIPGALFADFGPGPLVDDFGRVLFQGELQVGPGGVTAQDAAGLWLSDGAGAVDLLLQIGHALPAESDALLDIYRAVQGTGGDVAVAGPLGPEGSLSSDVGAIVGIADGGVPVIAIRDGDTVPLAAGASPPGDYLLATTYADRPDARAVGAGRVAFLGSFEDGRTAAVLATLPVPEPGQCAQLLAGALVLWMARGRTRSLGRVTPPEPPPGP